MQHMEVMRALSPASTVYSFDTLVPLSHWSLKIALSIKGTFHTPGFLQSVCSFPLLSGYHTWLCLLGSHLALVVHCRLQKSRWQLARPIVMAIQIKLPDACQLYFIKKFNRILEIWKTCLAWPIFIFILHYFSKPKLQLSCSRGAP